MKQSGVRKIIFTVLVLTVIGIGLLHFFTPGHLGFYHDTYRRLSYLPIAVGSIMFGIRGGLILAFLTSLAFIPHILLYIGFGKDAYLSELTEILLYFTAAIVIGAITAREARLREKYRALSERLKKSYKRLHDETELLIEVEEQLKVSQKLSALGQLSASLAHEIKNPLSSIKGTAEILLDEFPAGHAKREFVEILMTEVSRLDASVNEILHYSREQKSMLPDKSLEPAAVVIRRVNKLLAHETGGKKIRLQTTGLSQAQVCRVDGNRFSQVFLNVMLNAIDAVDVGGTIQVNLEILENEVSVSVSDSGPGISIEDRDRIFEPFFSKKDGGTGLGLSISQKIMSSLGGRMTVSDAVFGGACFDMRLPLSR